MYVFALFLVCQSPPPIFFQNGSVFLLRAVRPVEREVGQIEAALCVDCALNVLQCTASM